MPEMLALVGNYPNPFNPTTTIYFSLSQAADVTVKIFDLRGQLVETLVTQAFGSGDQAVTWDAGNRPSGSYFYKVTASGKTQVGRCILVK